MPPVLQGYITAVHLPDGFDMNDRHVVMSTRTGVGYIGDKVLQSDTPLRAELRPGAYVEVAGNYDAHTRTAKAVTVCIYNERTKTRTGNGLILRVVSAGPEPVYRADGYQIRINSSSSVSFHSGLKRLSDVGPDTMLRYKGKLGKDGILEATRAQFTRIAGKPEIVSPSQSSEAPNSAAHTNGGAMQGSAPNEDKLQMWHAIPPDQPLQQRVARIGLSLVPAYMSEKAGNNPSKISYRFYAVDDEKMRSGYSLIDKHIILIPKQAAERLQNDSQLAAVLAEGIAQKLQTQVITAGDVAESAAGVAAAGGMIFMTPFAIAGYATYLIPAMHKGEQVLETPIQDQRDRIALGLMADAGYDPHQAPEAWRLLAPVHPALDPQSLPYPLRSEYQLNVLITLYDPHTAPVATVPQ